MQTPFPDHLRLPFAFDPDQLVGDLQALASVEWTSHFVTQNYDGDWSVIPLRGPAGAKHPVMMIYADPTATAFEDMPILRACPYFRAVIAAFASPVQTVRLMRLTPGSVIKEHTDLELSVEEGFARIHIPITTNPNVEFKLNGVRIVMEPGSVWYLRLSDPHSVNNAGDGDRVHMVIDLVADDWLKTKLAASLRVEKS
jgi:Aspartyl/Asparaginyl beta-hydroxylase